MTSLPAAAAAAQRLAELLSDTAVWGLPRDHITVLGADASAPAILSAVRDAARAATDTLMVYFAGHGLRDRSERLYLALEDTDADHPQIGSLAYPMLRDVIRQVGHRSRYRLTILDCCYSGLAGSMNAITAPTRNDLAQVLGEPQSPENNRARGWDDYGDLVLTSAPPTRRSFVLPGGKAALDQHCRLAQCVARRLGRVGVSRRG